MDKNKDMTLRCVIVRSNLSNKEKGDLLNYLEELIEKANNYEGLCK